MQMDTEIRALVAQLLAASEPFTPTFLPQFDEHGRISIEVSEGQYAVARAARKAARAALGYPAPTAPVSNKTARRAADKTVEG